ncbi:hypothetical protein UFOVP124_27 [uncultured Caudovirales phage]|uniref:Uncharacterized protein n=1 Tax=uncultured Caudovirales phage TaxID=2100421 RepID=A0A6J5L8D8_9CAUD|nr:hypothetical protein UFOVP124_27 [uncultured Caudovirales phage]
MAYVSPTITASSQTYANLKTKGFAGYVDGLIAANSSLTQNQINLIRGAVKTQSNAGANVFARNIVDHWLDGNPITTADLTQRILDSTTALKAMLAAMEEMAVLWDANQGTLTTKADYSGMPVPVRTL